MRFVINTPQMKNAAEMMESIAAEMESLSSDLAGLVPDFSVGESDELLRAKMQECVEQLSREINSVKNCQMTLGLIIDDYVNTEKALAGHDGTGNSIINMRQTSSTNVSDANSDVTDEEIDKKLAKDIKKALSWKWKYTFIHWLFAGEEGRKEIIRDMLILLAPIYGIETPKLTIGPEENPTEGYVTGGYFSSDNNEIWINEDFFKNGFMGRDDAIHTLLHEMRHAYQWNVVNHPDDYDYDPETIEAWKNNFYNYISVDTGGEFDAYDSQAIETDADDFADRIQTQDWDY